MGILLSVEKCQQVVLKCKQRRQDMRRERREGTEKIVNN